MKKFTCGHCGGRIAIPDRKMGQLVVCPDCGKRYDIFGSGGAKKRAAELDIDFLGDVPITMQLRIAGDEGRTPQAFDDPEAVKPWLAIAKNLVRGLPKKHPGAGPLPVLTV